MPAPLLHRLARARACAAVVIALLITNACATGEPGRAGRAGATAADEPSGRAAGVRAYERGDYERARPLLAEEAEAGNALAARYLGRIHLGAIGVERDRRAAGEAFQRGAELGDPVSQVRLAKLYYDGLDFETNHRKARYWFRQAAEQGNGEAQYALYNMLLQGLGGDIHGADAFAWLWVARESGHPAAQQAWARRGVMIPESAAEALRAAHGPEQLPEQPAFADAAAEVLRAPPAGEGEPVRPVRLRKGFPDDQAIRIVGVRAMDGVTPVDGVNHPWIAYTAGDVTGLLERLAPRLEGEASLVEAEVMTEVARGGGEKLQVRARSFRRKAE